MKSNYLRALMLFAGFCLVFWASIAVGSEDCIKCHEKFINARSSLTSVHRPFLKEQCKDCHQKTGDSNEQSTNSVSWRIRMELSPGLHLIPIDERWKNQDLLIRVESFNTSEKYEEEVPYFSASELPELQDLFIEPAIEHLRVSRLQRDILLRATVVWQTPSPTKCEIYYQSNGKAEGSIYEDHFSTFHKVDLDELHPNEHYKLVVKASDPGNHKTVSKTLMFDTDQAAISQDVYENHAPLNIKEISLVRIDNTPYLKLRVSGDALLKIGLSGPVFRTNGSEPKAATIKEKHPLLVSKYQAGYLNCFNCHKEEARDSHPVNIRPLPGMAPPKDFSMPRGKVACISCHDPHGTQYTYLLRRQQGILCQGCHAANKYVLRRY